LVAGILIPPASFGHPFLPFVPNVFFLYLSGHMQPRQTPANPEGAGVVPSSRLKERLNFLESLRGLAAVAVMLFHFFAAGVSPIHGPLAASLPAWGGAVLEHLFCGVDVFFVLSGFVIAYSMAGQAADWRYAGNFILRRSVRLGPAYWVASALMVSYFLAFWPSKWHDFYVMYGGVAGIVANLFYVQNLSWINPATSILDVSWTLCLEVQFYLTYLLVLVLAHYARRRWVAGLGVALVAGWSLLHWLQAPTSDFAGRAWTFFLGVALYGALTRGVAWPVVLGPLSALAAYFIWRPDTHSLATLATALLIYVVGVSGKLGSFMNFRPLLHLGRISYSIYLLHMVLGLNFLSQTAARIGANRAAAWTAYAVAVVLALAGAELLHRWVEAPSNRWSQRLKR
jgi:peptidoglycan/LPS O-acetylase OafA/YrhL